MGRGDERVITYMTKEDAMWALQGLAWRFFVYFDNWEVIGQYRCYSECKVVQSGQALNMRAFNLRNHEV